ncbi:hypothetical protein CFT12S05168_08250 [Campylobacter fetus subsp. testudinum]|nr:hypothetical protein CFT12S05168_08250 [Campylobacter fetus subsp. testudinum]
MLNFNLSSVISKHSLEVLFASYFDTYLVFMLPKDIQSNLFYIFIAILFCITSAFILAKFIEQVQYRLS